jgi:hypothetical protein
VSDFKLADGTLLPKPRRREVHRYTSRSTRDHPIECFVVENEFEGMITLSASARDPRWDTIASDYLAAVVAHRINEGATLISMSDLGAALRR